jgi:hypothetical protein
LGEDDRLIELEAVRGLQHADRCRGRVARARDREAADDSVADVRLEQGLDRACPVLPGPDRIEQDRGGLASVRRKDVDRLVPDLLLELLDEVCARTGEGLRWRGFCFGGTRRSVAPAARR